MRLTLRGHVIWYNQYLWCEAKWVGRGREVDEEHGKNFVEKEFQLAKAKLGRDGEGEQWSYRDGML